MANLINKSDDPRKDWAKVNILAAQVDDLRKQIGLQREYITTLRKNLGSLAAGMHPFKVYQIPPHLRASTSAEDWRKVRVRSGRALGVDIVTGTDGATEVDEGGFPSTTDITVPASTDNYTIYLTLSTSAVSHSDTPPAESQDVIHIAVCDSDTRSAQKELVIRQLVRTDILSTGGGGAPGRYRVKSIQNQYLICVRWDGTTEGTTYYNIARPYKLRNVSKTETIDGAAITYTPSGTQSRTAASTIGSETQVVVPRYLVNDEIYADEPQGGVAVTSPAGITLMDCNRDGRAWAEVYS